MLWFDAMSELREGRAVSPHYLAPTFNSEVMNALSAGGISSRLQKTMK
jgi:hypothetical protein